MKTLQNFFMWPNFLSAIDSYVLFRSFWTKSRNFYKKFHPTLIVEVFMLMTSKLCLHLYKRLDTYILQLPFICNWKWNKVIIAFKLLGKRVKIISLCARAKQTWHGRGFHICHLTVALSSYRRLYTNISLKMDFQG